MHEILVLLPLRLPVLVGSDVYRFNGVEYVPSLAEFEREVLRQRNVSIELP